MEALAALESLGQGRTENGKRPAQEDAAAAGKRARTDVYAEQARNTRDEVARRLAAADARGADDDALDEASMKRLVLSFEKRVNENMRMRAKFAAEPHRFLNAEIELYADLKKLHALATSPALLPAFVATQTLATILALLSHENLDISIEVVDLLSELTDADLLTELHDLTAADALVDALLGANGLEMIIGHMARCGSPRALVCACVRAEVDEAWLHMRKGVNGRGEGGKSKPVRIARLALDAPVGWVGRSPRALLPARSRSNLAVRVGRNCLGFLMGPSALPSARATSSSRAVLSVIRSRCQPTCPSSAQFSRPLHLPRPARVLACACACARAGWTRKFQKSRRPYTKAC
jgi:hypothetical protein